MTEAATLEQAEDVARMGLEAFGLLEALFPCPRSLSSTVLRWAEDWNWLCADYRAAADSVRAMGFPGSANGTSEPPFQAAI
jgi:hypothetical protein